LEGIVRGIDSKGALLLEIDGDIQEIISGSVVEVKNKKISDINLIAIDIGNTSTRIGKISGASEIETDNIPTNPQKDFPDRLIGSIRKLYGEDVSLVDGAAVSCVVEQLEDKVLKKLKSQIPGTILNVTGDMNSNVKINVNNPKSVGADRICNAAAAHEFYGGDIVVIDLGTANTFDVISSEGEYLGGTIAPGADSMEDALISRASKLDNIEFKLPETSIGNTTESSMNAGLYYTLKGQIDSTLAAIKRDWKKNFKVIFTGGGIEKLDKEITENHIVDRDITLRGLASIFSYQKTLDK
jgi:type III pantothenate kinase